MFIFGSLKQYHFLCSLSIFYFQFTCDISILNLYILKFDIYISSILNNFFITIIFANSLNKLKITISIKSFLGYKQKRKKLTTDYGTDIHPDTPTKIFQKIIKKYNLKRITFHGIRHTTVSLMIRNGIQQQLISRKVEHSSIQTTDRIYSHFFEDQLKDVPNIMNNLISVKAN